MLVLARKLGEQLFIGDNIVVTVVRIGPNSVRLGIDAPNDLSIVRSELVESASGGPRSRLAATECKLEMAAFGVAAAICNLSAAADNLLKCQTDPP